MVVMKKMIALLCASLFAVAFSASAQGPRKIAPGSMETTDYLYVFGPGASKDQGKDDSLQIVFFELPASAGEVELFVWDPGSGSRFERDLGLYFWRSVKTTFTVYGGEGALSAPESQSLRPSANQPGRELASQTFGKGDNAGEWVSLGTFNSADGEVIGNSAYLKLVAHGVSGSGSNFFKVGTSAANAEIFAFDFTLHLPPEDEAVMKFNVAVPAGASELIESNFDMDDANVPTLAGHDLRSSLSGKWLDNRVPVSPAETARMMPYQIHHGTQGYANAGFHISDGQGRPLAVYFSTTVLPGRPVEAADGTIDTSLLRLTKRMPPKAAVGEEFDVTLTLDAKQTIGNVQVIDMLPEGLELVSAEPQPQVSGTTLAWHFDRLEAGDQRVITMRVRPTAVTTYENCITVTAEPLVCTVTMVGQPELAIEKTGPAEAIINSDIVYSITVKNTGTFTAKNVVVVDTVPQGLTHASGQNQLRYELGDLAEGQAKQFDVTLRAAERGRFCNVADASAGNAADAKAEACTVVKQPGLTVKKSGPAEQFIGKQASYTIEVGNPGDIDLMNVVVVDTVPAGTQIVSAPGAEIDGNRVTWRFDTLPAGKKLTNLTVVLTSREPGNRCNGVSVATAEGLTESDEVCTLWQGYPALLIEVIDTVDPLQPGEVTTYEIIVTNQGTAADKNIKIVANFPAELTPMSAAGDTQGTIQGQSVDFAVYPTLAPKQKIIWRIQAKAVKSGDARPKFSLTSALLQTPVVEEESTQIY